MAQVESCAASFVSDTGRLVPGLAAVQFTSSDAYVHELNTPCQADGCTAGTAVMPWQLLWLMCLMTAA